MQRRLLVPTILAAAQLLGSKPVLAGDHDSWQAALTGDGQIAVIIELKDEATTRTYARLLRSTMAAASPGHPATARATGAAQEQLAHVEESQQRLLPALEGPRIGARVLYRVQRVLNGIAVKVDPAALAGIEALPGVKAVHPLVPHYPTTSTSVPWMTAPALWQAAGVLGDGVRIGIIDSGIDYLHKTFGGSGSYSGQSFTDTVVPWSSKVVGGTDLCGDSYDGNNSLQPDGDPMDCGDNGHGSHVAGIAAGYGVTSGDATYGGPYTESADFLGLKIGPGVAPGAQLYAIRVFGCSGSTRLTVEGLEWAVDPNGDGNFADRLDVVNLSLGSPFGSATDTSSRAADNAAEAGVIVVVAAGNEGDASFVVGSPSTSRRAISVAASADIGVTQGALSVLSPTEIAGDYVVGAALFGPATPVDGLTGTLVMASPADGCAALTNTGDVVGRIALIDRGSCLFVDKVKNAQNAGAIAAIVTNNTTGIINMAGSDSTITIPSVFISQADGVTLKNRLTNPGVTVTLYALPQADMVASFSSRGPSLDGTSLKPEISAPGASVTSAAARSGAGADVSSRSGTSMATPHVAGAMALLRQLHPTWSVAELKALAMNTATDMFVNPGQTPPLHSPTRVGAGRMDLRAAGQSEVVAFDDANPELVGLSFAHQEIPDSATLSGTLRVVNKGASAITYTLAYESRDDLPGVGVSFPEGQQITIPAAGSVTFAVRLDATASAMRHSRHPGMATTQDGRPRHWMSEEAGFVTLTPPTGQQLRVPLRVSARPVASVGTHEFGLILGATSGAVTVHLDGQGIATGTDFPTDIVSLVTPLELHFNPAAAPGTGPGVITHAGVTSDYPAQVAAGGSVESATVLFGIAVKDAWNTPNEVVFEVSVDADRDGTIDHLLITDNYAEYANSEADPSDVLGVKRCNRSGSGCTWIGGINGWLPSERDTVAFNTDVMVLAIPANQLDLTASSSRFDFWVRAELRRGGRGSTTGKLTYDVVNPGIATLGQVSRPLAAFPGNALQLAYDRTSYGALGTGGLLLLHHHNGAGARAQVLPVSITDCSLTCSATVPATATSGQPVALAATAQPSPCTGTVLHRWDPGDGSATIEGAQAEHTFTAPGTYSWTMEASLSGLTCTSSGSIEVAPASPFRAPRRRLSRSGPPPAPLHTPQQQQ